ncbi:hypothetical protein TH47_17215 [Thalassospira sp. MCCC 1A02803]|nr:hypothetical protein TH47_17215 [Thalassospira sp. MCCC 1A02803]
MPINYALFLADFNSIPAIRNLLMQESRVFVRAYERIRYGNREYVCAHTRRWPRQLTFAF